MKKVIFFMFCLFIGSCANHKLHYSADAKDWEAKLQMPTVKPQYALYGIGDSGYLPSGEVSPALVGLKKMLGSESKNSGVVFMGDNIYPAGMPNKRHPDRKQAEKNIDTQIDAVREYIGDIFFIPGNHDWRQDDSQKGVQRQEKHVEAQLKNRFYPNDGCSGPKAFELSDDAVLIVFDSEWYTQDWDQQIDFNEKCDIKTRSDFIYELTDQIRKYGKDKRVIISMHHPIYTNGVHGGKFEAMNYLFPLRLLNDKLKIPLPGIGVLYPLLRKNVGQRQDINGAKYKELREKLLASTDVFKDIIFISGHEHNMQYIYREDHHHIVAGSGCKRTPVGMGGGAEFSWSQYGFSRISVFEKGETWLEYFACEGGEAKVVYAKKITDKLTEFEAQEETFVIPRKPFIEEPISEENTDKGGFFHFLMGKQYSELYNIPLKARVTNLSIKEGGLTGVKRGGGFQTNSVRLTNSKEKDWVMRAMKKDPTRLLPDEFVGTVAIEVVDHFLTTAHPLGAFTIPPMAKAIGILHTKPELLYIPKQPALGEFNEDHGDKLYLFEDRPDDNRSDRDNFGNSKNLISTTDLVQEMKDDGRHRPDQQSVIRARLFDMIIGDWDRHDDQWRWGAFDGEGKRTIYKPVPRDRDQVYSIFEGPVIALGRIFSPGIAKFQTFNHKIKNIEYFNFNARYFDRSFLNELTWENWQEEITHLQKTLTNEVIHEGVNQMQADFYALHGEEIEAKIRSRRDQLAKYSRNYYESLAKIVSVHATNNDDIINVVKFKGGITVTLSDLDKKDKLNYTYYQRTFSDKETNEVRVYGLDGDDKFSAGGEGSAIKIRFIGGTDDDTYVNRSKASKVHVYDYADNSEVKNPAKLKVHLSNDYSYNTYDRKDFKYNHSFIFPLIGFNPDNGFMLGGTFSGVWHGFKRNPHKTSHKFSGLYSFETGGYKLNYSGDFVDAIGKWNVRLEGLFQDKLFSNNYFGPGNNSINHQESPFDQEDDYNRVRNSIISGKLLLEKNPTNGAFLFIGPKAEIRKVDRTDGRYISQFFDDNDVIFNNTTYVGGEAGFRFRNVDKKFNPSQGASIDIVLDYLGDVNNFDLNKTSFTFQLGLYYPVDKKETIIWAHKFGTGFTFSDNALFYHQQQLGGQWGLRGFRNERFTGKSAAYYNTDFRISLFKFNSYFAPSTVGIYTGFDIGRVWLNDDPTPNKDQWHTNFGGGLWISPFEMALIKVSYFTSGEEEGRLLIGLGFDF